MVPISAVADIKIGVGPVSVKHYGQLPRSCFRSTRAGRFGRRRGHARAGARARDAAGGCHCDASPAARRRSRRRSGRCRCCCSITILIIYMVLAILYEHYGHPITILTALPFAGFGALLMLMLFNMELNIFSFVGIILLVGLVKKNGIMMVDFALQIQREKGLPAARSDRRSVDHPLPSDHDDDDGGDLRHAAARARHGHRARRCASRSVSRWSAGCVLAAADAVRDADVLRHAWSASRDCSKGRRAEPVAGAMNISAKRVAARLRSYTIALLGRVGPVTRGIWGTCRAEPGPIKPR